jgi:hypothetical protein
MAVIRIIKDPKEAQFREEILFWQRMIKSWEATSSDEVPDRMRDALALSMYRLELYLADDVFFEKDIPPHGLDMRKH